VGTGGETEVASVAIVGVASGSEVAFHHVESDLGGFEPGLDGGRLCGDPILLSLYQIQRHSSGIVGLEEFGFAR
jgi:hypothetical protein